MIVILSPLESTPSSDLRSSGSRSASPESVDRSFPLAQLLSQGPVTSVYNAIANLMTSSCHAARPEI